MGSYVGCKSNVEQSADKVVRKTDRQTFHLVQNLISAIIGGIIVGVVVFFVQTHFHKKALAQSVAETIAIAVTNDLFISADVSEAIQQRILKKEFTNDPEMFELIYRPTVELPSVSDILPLESEVISATDEYKRRLYECAKHRKIYLAELRSGGKQSNLKTSLFTYCVSLDSVVKCGFLLANQLRQHYPSTQVIFEKRPTSYQPADMNQIAEAVGGRWNAKQSGKGD